MHQKSIFENDIITDNMEKGIITYINSTSESKITSIIKKVVKYINGK